MPVEFHDYDGPTFAGEHAIRDNRAYEIAMARAGHPVFVQLRASELTAERTELGTAWGRTDLFNIPVSDRIAHMYARVDKIGAEIKAAKAARGLHA